MSIYNEKLAKVKTCRTQQLCTEHSKYLQPHSNTDAQSAQSETIISLLLPRLSPAESTLQSSLQLACYRKLYDATSLFLKWDTTFHSEEPTIWNLLKNTTRNKLSFSPAHIKFRVSDGVLKIWTSASKSEPVHTVTLNAVFPNLLFLLVPGEIPPEPTGLHSTQSILVCTLNLWSCQETQKSPNLPTNRCHKD